MITAKFSLDGRLTATATWFSSVRVYDSQSGDLVDVPVNAPSSLNQSLVWVGNSKNLFVLSHGNINYLDASTGTTLCSWPIHSSSNYGCIVLANNGTLIAASAGSSVSLWDPTTHKQLGSIIKHRYDIWSTAISANHDLVIGGYEAITLRKICKGLPSSYCEDVSALA